MLAVYAASQSKDDPLSGLEIGERPDPEPAPGWTTVTLKTAGLNHHDLFSLQGVGLPADRLPMILGCDGAGVDEDGNEVIIHAVVASEGWQGDETLDPRRTLLSELHDGTLAQKVLVPKQNVVPKPAGLSWEHAACLSTAWLTAYRMLFSNAGLTPGATVLVQGAGGGVATALVQLGSAAGYRMWVTSRDEAKGAKAVEIGADRAFASGERLPERVDAVMETVGAATWSHSVKSLKPGRHHRHLRSHLRRRAAEGRADPDLLPSAAGHRLDHGHPARARAPRAVRRAAGDRAGHRHRAAAGAGPRGVRQDGGRRPVRQGRLHGRVRSAGARRLGRTVECRWAVRTLKSP